MDLIPHGYDGFSLLSKNVYDNEEMAITSTCVLNKIPIRIVKSSKEVSETSIPVGNIKFVQEVLGKVVKPDYYPDFMKYFLRRNVWVQDKWPLGKVVFIKPNDEHKRFNGFITNGGYRGKKKPPYICSDVIKIKNEWRYYVCKGKILFSNWYKGDNEDIPAPLIDDFIPKEICCCLDMGEMYNGEIVLVESQPPFSCGWYGKQTVENNEKYTRWIAYGWEYLKNNY